MHRGNHLFLIKFRYDGLLYVPSIRPRGFNYYLTPCGESYLCATQVAILARDENPCFFRILPM
jgi:hypothetical protein